MMAAAICSKNPDVRRPTESPFTRRWRVTIKYSYDDLGRQTKVTYLDAQGHEMQMELVVQRVVPGGNGAQGGLMPEIISSPTTVNRSVPSSNYRPGRKRQFSFRTVTVRRGSQIITLQVERGDLGTYIGLARVDEQKQAGAPAQRPLFPLARMKLLWGRAGLCQSTADPRMTGRRISRRAILQCTRAWATPIDTGQSYAAQPFEPFRTRGLKFRLPASRT